MTTATDIPSLLTVRDLSVAFGRGKQMREVLHGIDLDIRQGRVLALVGESGSGKSVLSRTLIGLSGAGAQVRAAKLSFGGRDLLKLSTREWRSVRGAEIGFVSQDALVSLDPLRTVGKEVSEVLRVHGVGDRAGRRQRVLDALREAGLVNPEQLIGQRAGQLSGGMRQRALIASAIISSPKVLIADEPTTALDATVQAQIIALLQSFAERGDTIVFVSHDLGVVSQLADDLVVIRDGEIVERGPTAAVFDDPQHDYTKLLLSSIPTLAHKGGRISASRGQSSSDLSSAQPAPQALPARPAIRVEGLQKSYSIAGAEPRTVVKDVSFEFAAGTTLGLVGESGAGKSTIAGMVLGTVAPDSGAVWLGDSEWTALSEAERRPLRPRLQMIYQDPLSSFDPRHTVAKIIGDALSAVGVPRSEWRTRSRVLLDSVGLQERQLDQHPLHLSGGQRQRVAIARALATEPHVVLCDEPVSALDASIQGQILDLLLDLQRDRGMSYLFISHDLGVIRHVSDIVVVLRNGSVVEQGDAAVVLDNPQHDYTKELLAAVPVPRRRPQTSAADIEPELI